MGRYSFIGSFQNLSGADINQLHNAVASGKHLRSSTNMFKDINSMQRFGDYKRGLANYKHLRPGNLAGAWFN